MRQALTHLRGQSRGANEEHERRSAHFAGSRLQGVEARWQRDFCTGKRDGNPLRIGGTTNKRGCWGVRQRLFKRTCAGHVVHPGGVEDE